MFAGQRNRTAAFVDRFTVDGRTNVALSYRPANTRVRKFYLDIGFIETGEVEGDEVVARFVG